MLSWQVWDAELATLAVHQADLSCTEYNADHDKAFNKQHSIGQNNANGATSGDLPDLTTISKQSLSCHR